MSEDDLNINTNLYSRQIAVYGLETMIHLSMKKVFISGMRGIGGEIAKNIILAGPSKVTIFDMNKSTINDLTSNYYINEKDVVEGKRRDEASFEELSKLNPYVQLDIMKNHSIISHLKEVKYDVVVITEFMPKNTIIELDNYCRENNIGFIYCAELGITGFCFVDFGNDFVVHEKSEEEPKKFFINSITKSNPGIINLSNPIKRFDFKDGDDVIFKDIEGMKELNDCSQVKIKIIDEYNVEIIDTSKFTDYIGGGFMIKKKEPVILHYESFEKRIEEPYNEEMGFPEQIDTVNPNTNEILHIGILALCSFYNNHNCLPELNSEDDAEELLKISKNIFNEKDNINEEEKEFWIKGLKEEIKDFDNLFKKTIKNLSLWARAEISPIASFLGGIVAQEIIKHTGKFMPINQWLWLNFSQIVENLDNNKIDRSLKGTRYDDQIAIFGNQMQQNIEKTNIFMIGAGALGCEFLKAFSLMGIASNDKFSVTVTDNDNIIESNLNRQFLFRKENIGKSKSKVACQSVKRINPSFNCIDLQARIGPENEEKFNEKFWKKQKFVINAVDNVEARKFISKKSKMYRRILIDSGTNGTKANSQVIIPYETLDYLPPEKKPENQIPMCTLRNFPTSIEHCIEWARDNFDGYFISKINEVKLFIEDKEKFYSQIAKQMVPSDQITKMKDIIRYVKMLINKDFDECLKIGLEEYNQSYYNSINLILKNNPPNSLNKDGTKFWSGNKRCPSPLPFNIDNKLIFLFIKKYAQILANSMSIPIIDDDKYIKTKLEEINSIDQDLKELNYDNVIKYNSYQTINNLNVNISAEQEAFLKQKKIKDIKERILLAKEELKKIKEEANKLNISAIKNNIKNIFISQEFEKDNDKNGHIDFIYSSSNLRAEIFKIEKCNRIKTRLIAGKIIPAIATTTAAIVGLVSLELYTLYQTNDIKYLRNCNIILSHNKIEFNNPVKYQEIQNEEKSELQKTILPNSKNTNGLRGIITKICSFLIPKIIREI